jgi:eukaryotic-like serine/threonine-protein kinase
VVPVLSQQVDLPPRYRVVRHIANGGMATVWAAEDSLLERLVAVKVLAPGYAADVAARRRFTREARAAARVSDHPNVVTIFDIGDHDGSAFIVMEHFAGGTVADRLKALPSEQRMPAPLALRWLRETAGALDAAHANDVVHRDVKPGNLLLDENGRLAVGDFGIASLAGETAVTATGQVLGTAAYLSPEQARGHQATAASDRFSLAVVAYELLCGGRPFPGDTAMEQARARLQQEPIDPGSICASAYDALKHGLARAPEDRPETAAAFVAELEAALGDDATPTTVMPGARRRSSGPEWSGREHPRFARGAGAAGGAAAGSAAADAVAGRTGAEPWRDADAWGDAATPRGADAWSGAKTGRGADARSNAATQPGTDARSGTNARSGNATQRGANAWSGATTGRGADAWNGTATRRGVASQSAAERGRREPPPDPVARPRNPHRNVIVLAIVAALCVVVGAGAALISDNGNNGGKPTAGPRATASKSQGSPTGGVERAAASESSGTETSGTPAPGAADGAAADGRSAAQLNDAGYALLPNDAAGAVPLLQQAVESFRAGGDTSSITYAYSLYNLGWALDLAGRPGEAIPYLEERLKISDYKRGIVQAELRKAQQAAAGTPADENTFNRGPGNSGKGKGHGPKGNDAGGFPGNGD